MSDDLRMSTDLTVSPFYHSAVNAVTRPNQATWCSDYFIDRWMPLLGNEGTRIVLALRRRGYNNRKTGEKREEIKMDRAELSAMVGCSEDTITREMGINKKSGRPHNPWLHLFVRKFEHKKRDPRTGKLWQELNGYFVAMDDPVHPDDWPLVAAYVREREALTDKGSSPETHFASSVDAPETQNATPGAQNAVDAPQNASFKTQNASRYIRESDSELPLETPKTPAARPEDSLALFPDNPSDSPQEPKRWAALTEAERAPFVAQAERELKAIYPEHAGNLNRRLVDVRAKNLFEQAAKPS